MEEIQYNGAPTLPCLLVHQGVYRSSELGHRHACCCDEMGNLSTQWASLFALAAVWADSPHRHQWQLLPLCVAGVIFDPGQTGQSQCMYVWLTHSSGNLYAVLEDSFAIFTRDKHASMIKQIEGGTCMQYLKTQFTRVISKVFKMATRGRISLNLILSPLWEIP